MRYFSATTYGKHALERATAERGLQLCTLENPQKVLTADNKWTDQLHASTPAQQWQDAAAEPRRSGLRLVMSLEGKPQSWPARTDINGLRLMKNFAIYRYGQQAQALAIAERASQLQACMNYAPACRPGARRVFKIGRLSTTASGGLIGLREPQ